MKILLKNEDGTSVSEGHFERVAEENGYTHKATFIIKNPLFGIRSSLICISLSCSLMQRRLQTGSESVRFQETEVLFT